MLNTRRAQGLPPPRLPPPCLDTCALVPRASPSLPLRQRGGPPGCLEGPPPRQGQLMVIAALHGQLGASTGPPQPLLPRRHLSGTTAEEGRKRTLILPRLKTSACPLFRTEIKVQYPFSCHVIFFSTLKTRGFSRPIL